VASAKASRASAGLAVKAEELRAELAAKKRQYLAIDWRKAYRRGPSRKLLQPLGEMTIPAEPVLAAWPYCVRRSESERKRRPEISSAASD